MNGYPLIKERKMICYNHPGIDVVATCNYCSKGLCLECSNKYLPPLCDGCAMSAAKYEQKNIIKNVVLTIIFAVIGFCIVHSYKGHFLTCLLGAYIGAGILWGWYALNKITPNVFLFMPIVGWLIYFGIKFVLAFYVGLVALPYQVFTFTRRWLKSKNLESASKVQRA